jgi:hypothetical protein
MPTCPNCGTPFAPQRWYRTGGGRYGSLDTRCNTCHSRIVVFVPIVFWLAAWLLPLAVLVLVANHLPSLLPMALVVLLAWMLAAPFFMFLLFGRIRVV